MPVTRGRRGSAVHSFLSILGTHQPVPVLRMRSVCPGQGSPRQTRGGGGAEGRGGVEGRLGGPWGFVPAVETAQILPTSGLTRTPPAPASLCRFFWLPGLHLSVCCQSLCPCVSLAVCPFRSSLSDLHLSFYGSASVSFLPLLPYIPAYFCVPVSLRFTSCPSPAPAAQPLWAEGLSLFPPPPHPQLLPASQPCLCGRPSRALEGVVRAGGRAAWRAHPFLPFQAGRLGQWAF